MHIFLVEGSNQLLSAMSDRSAEQSAAYLKGLGVELRLGALVKEYDGHTVTVSDGSRIPAATVIWAAGIRGNIPAGVDASLIVQGNRIRVDEQCRILPDFPVYVVGDLAYMETKAYPKGHPQVASVAIQQAGSLAKNLWRARKGKPPKPFVYKDKGSMATVGRNLAVVDIPKPRLHLGGFLAWMIWMGLHLMLILGVKNRLFVFLNWLYNYLTYDQNLRLIFREFNRDHYARTADYRPASEKAARVSPQV
jgi:NADH dehydrogenase